MCMSSEETEEDAEETRTGPPKRHIQKGTTMGEIKAKDH